MNDAVKETNGKHAYYCIVCWRIFAPPEVIERYKNKLNVYIQPGDCRQTLCNKCWALYKASGVNE